MPSDPVFRRSRVIGDAEIDDLGHVNNVVWVQLVMQLAGAHSRAVGLDFAAYRELGGIYVVRRHELDYLQPAFPHDEIIEETWIAEMRGARTLRRARFTRKSDAARLLESTSHWAFVEFTTQRPRRLPSEVLRRFTVWEEPSP
ncbi:MAG TPA: thioesterase family protein [Myxococcota bacterium]|nr:thioesterase family protein [Myxococcota bacterium]